jgi:diguanylate cyclase (GGDEF)-like protein
MRANNMKLGYWHTVYTNEEDRQAAHILSMLIFLSWATYFIVGLTGLYWGDWNSITATLVSSILHAIPFWLLRHRYLRVSSLIFVLNVLGTVTLIATLGQGVHDLAIMIYPIIIFLAGLTVHGTDLRLCVGLTLVSMGWLVSGEANGWFLIQPFNTPSWADFLIVAVILLVAGSAVELLATNMRKSLDQARQEIVQRKHVEEKLRYQSTHDTLTGVYNRALFEEELERFESGPDFPVSVIVADVDGLKMINDTLGHATGDELLRRTANLLRSMFRSSDVLARIGGDEFAVLLPTTNAATAEQMVVRVRECLIGQNIQNPDLRVQLSLGVATAEVDNITKTYTLADQRMYADKSARKSNPIKSSAT